MSQGKLSGRVALVTGASRGIGREIARLFAEQGANLCINYARSQEAAESIAEQCRSYGRRVLIVQADVSQEDGARRLVESTVSEFGRIDILVNNAGILTQSLVKDMTVEMWDEMITSDLRSVFLCTRNALPSMIEQRFGRIINVASQLGQKGAPELAHYSAAKAGVIGFTKALAREVGEYGITVNCIAPGPIETDMVARITESWKEMKRSELPLLRFGTVDEVAPTALLLAAEPDGNIYTGQTLGPNSGDVML
ncbi:MAG: 3-oxoacyl-ACP reductase FabG [Actinobacteria bacterium]|nr:3-oxoacyl-ACP reductase FabG [Actinomycetota bacterium]